MNKRQKSISYYLETISLLAWGLLFLAFPLIISISFTDPFILPKEILLASVTVLTIILLGARMIVEGEIKLRKTPFDIPLLVFGVVILLSALLSKNQFDSL